MSDLSQHRVYLPFIDICMNPQKDSKNERRRDLLNVRCRYGLILSTLDLDSLGKMVLKLGFLTLLACFSNISELFLTLPIKTGKKIHDQISMVIMLWAFQISSQGFIYIFFSFFSFFFFLAMFLEKQYGLVSSGQKKLYCFCCHRFLYGLQILTDSPVLFFFFSLSFDSLSLSFLLLFLEKHDFSKYETGQQYQFLQVSPNSFYF